MDDQRRVVNVLVQLNEIKDKRKGGKKEGVVYVSRESSVRKKKLSKKKIRNKAGLRSVYVCLKSRTFGFSTPPTRSSNRNDG